MELMEWHQCIVVLSASLANTQFIYSNVFIHGQWYFK